MQVDPSKEVTLTLPAGVFFTAIAAMSKQPYEQVAQSIGLMEQGLQQALTPEQQPPA